MPFKIEIAIILSMTLTNVKTKTKDLPMTKKILLSVAAAALLSTSAFASGTLSTDTTDNINTGSISEESYLQNGMDIIDLKSLRYTAKLAGSGSVSDPLFVLDITDLEFAGHIDDNLQLVNGFDENGRGLTPAQLASNNFQGNGIENLLENGYFFGSTMVDVDDNSIVPLVFSQINEINGRWYAKYSGSSLFDMHDGHTYQIISNQFNQLPFKYQRDTGLNDGYIAGELYSLTVDPINPVDTAEFNPDTNFPKQFSVSCVRKFDGLINFENDRVSFVNPEHGARADYANHTPVPQAEYGANDSMINRDRIIFEIHNARTAGDTNTRWMSGHLSEFSVDTEYAPGAATNNFNTWVDTQVNIFPDAELNNIDTTNAGSIAPGSFFATGTTSLTFVYPDEPILPGTTAVQIDLVKPDNLSPIRPVKFTNPDVDLEGGVTPNSLTDGTENVGSLAIVSDVAQSTLDNPNRDIAPQNMTNSLPDNVGEWMDHAYIAQIAGAESGGAANMKTKFYIVNRGCTPATPTFKVIYDGMVYETNGLGEVAVNEQKDFKLKDIMLAIPALSGVWNATTSTKVGVEIILGGVAEDFYIYAQVKNGTIGQFKDLPVYNTSSRD